MIDLEGMSKSEEYEYTLRRLATFSTGFSNKLLSGIDTAVLDDQISRFNEMREFWERNIQRKNNIRFESSYLDLKHAFDLCSAGKYGSAYFFAELSEQKAAYKPKLFMTEPFVLPPKNVGVIRCVDPFFTDMLDLFYARKISPLRYLEIIPICFEHLRPTVKEPHLLDEALELYKQSVRLFCVGQIDEAIYLGFDAHQMFEYNVGDRETYEIGWYREKFKFTIEDLADIKDLDLLNGWKFGGSPI